LGLRRTWDSAARRFVARRMGDDFAQRLRDALREPGELGVDPFGLDPELLERIAPIAWWLHRVYFRVQAFGLERLPQGPCLLVANHSGQIPVDGFLLATTLIFDAAEPRLLRSMVEKWVPTLPFVAPFMAQAGQVVGLPENCRRLLRQGEAILVFPEGVAGIAKTWDQRYRLQSFGGGFLRLALECGVPVVPVAVVGGEEQAPSFYNVKALGRVLGAPAFPVTPTFPWLGPAGLLPYPVRYRLHFGAPMDFEGDPMEDDEVLAPKVARVRQELQAMLDRGRKERSHVFW